MCIIRPVLCSLISNWYKWTAPAGFTRIYVKVCDEDRNGDAHQALTGDEAACDRDHGALGEGGLFAPQDLGEQRAAEERDGVVAGHQIGAHQRPGAIGIGQARISGQGVPGVA